MPTSDIFSEGNDTFKNSYFKNNEQELLDLVKNGQHPKALFIGCADSRVVPELITGAEPGDLFIVRNVGNFVAPYDPSTKLHASAPGIEYAVTALKVSEIIICGHTHCGAINSLFKEIDDPSLIHTKNWLSLGNRAKSFALMSLGKEAEKEKLYRLTEKLSVVSQIENLLTYPDVKKGVENDTLHIHGWIYDISSGEIEYYDPDAGKFRSLSALAQKIEDTGDAQ
jgi:carbonic anhydrase